MSKAAARAKPAKELQELLKGADLEEASKKTIRKELERQVGKKIDGDWLQGSIDNYLREKIKAAKGT